MSDQVEVRRIPGACEIDGCERTPDRIVALVEMSGSVMDELFACADHEAKARARISGAGSRP